MDFDYPHLAAHAGPPLPSHFFRHPHSSSPPPTPPPPTRDAYEAHVSVSRFACFRSHSLVWSSGRSDWGEQNVLAFDDKFNPGYEPTSGQEFVQKFSTCLREPPCSPERFEVELEKRKNRAEKKGVSLFTNGKDQPFVLVKYKKAFDDLSHGKKFDYTNMNWGDDQLEQFAQVLAACKGLEDA